MSIVVDHRDNSITWYMDADLARSLAEVIRCGVGPTDTAHEDADSLDAAADALDPPGEAPHAE